MTSKTFFLFAALAFLAAACGNPSSTKQKSAAPQDPFVSDVVGVSEAHLSPALWTQARGTQKQIMSALQIEAFNKKNMALDPTLYDLQALPDTFHKDLLMARIRSISKRASSARIFADGSKVTDADFTRYEAALNLGAIKKSNPVHFGLAVRRTALRTWPTADRIFSEGAKDRDIDRFQETALFPGDAVAILHESTDGKWLLVQSYNYIAWAPAKDVAIGPRQQVFGYGKAKNFLIITGDKVSTVFNPVEPAVSELQLDMGLKIPLDRPKALQNNLYGQNPYLSHMVLLPVRRADGSLTFKHALIRRTADVHVGYLPYTQANIINQAFKFLGERYGWGHRYNGRDCTGFVGEVYKTVGIKLPRNSGDQGKSAIGRTDRYDKTASLKEKIDRLKGGQPGDLVYIPGHVMMLLGQSDGQPFVIHDVHGLGYLKADGSFYRGTLNGVSVSPILPLRSGPEHSYLESAYAIKRVQ